ncbi:UbiX family flavin prenyltransferase [Kribbella solani]|uniref:Flavin prenyltransferase UbiX n=1 Tax=Kribbella solani TaxID=236067 RepID=A0A841DNB1_9ACTN|nr:UbiX family flavin prenyltransferase [Kribbella solani]MBB5980032.1 polyprenyl P-hydroxybenzoate/phenylacrylic acid decarboxylase-like protein [Kribbella solani]MDX2972729.1 UbiX family flavin prenyltransferase [Kribbella solani]MDX3005592.1 UbiX family flavin prenyltransferase [Kribbella solani]
MSAVEPPSRLVVGISGASAPHYGVRLVEALREHRPDIELHLVVSRGARRTIELELGRDPETVLGLADHVHDDRDLSAAISSGSFLTMGMAVAPCSIKSLSAIASSYNDNLLTRAADVCLKERRPLVLAVRETPLHLGHLRLMTQATESGATILPPVPAFYHRPDTVEDLIDHTVVKILDQFGIHLNLIQRWSS